MGNVEEFALWLDDEIRKLDEAHPLMCSGVWHSLHYEASVTALSLGIAKAAEILGPPPPPRWIGECDPGFRCAVRAQVRDALHRLANHIRGLPPPVRFVPTKFQQQILDALRGNKFLSVNKLADALGCPTSRLYKTEHDIKELKREGKVGHVPGRGYYCVDAKQGEKLDTSLGT